MRRAAGSAAIISLFAFLLNLPLLHLHPGGALTLGTVIHWHMPHDADVNCHSSLANQILGDGDSHDAQAVPFEISSLCAASAVQAPVLELFATLPTMQWISPEARCLWVMEPGPRAQAPPGVLIHLSFRSPPA